MGARIIGRTGKARGVEHAVTDVVCIGSGADCQLRMENPGVSQQHARIVRVGRQFFVEDLGSGAGTFVNGEAIARSLIRHLDVLSLGPDIDLIFLEDAPATPVQPARPFRASIVWTKGPYEGRADELSSPAELVIGRVGPFEDMREISRRHAVLTIDNEHLVIEDEGSSNGTSVNGTRITGPAILDDGDEVALAGVIAFRVSIPADSGRLAAFRVEADGMRTVRIPDAAGGSPDEARTLKSTPESLLDAPDSQPRLAKEPEIGVTKSDPNFGIPVGRPWSDGDTGARVVAEGDVPTYLDLHESPLHVPTAQSIAGVRLEGTETLTLGRGTFLVGRHAEADLHFDSRDVGRRHAKIHVRADGVVVEDLGAANGTFVNDEAVTGEAPLPDGSRLKFATIEFLITWLTSDAQLNA